MFLEKNQLVLCYEPDPTKAKVLYDSKIMEVRMRKDSRGRRSVEYLIHFQGWSANWDRYVAEEYVLKDTEENRALQNRLNEEAQILKQSLKKKKKRTLAEAIKDIRQERRRCLSVPTSDRQDDESSKSSFSDGDGLEDSSEEDEDNEEDRENEDEDDEETFPLVIPEDIKRRLEQDYHMITLELKLARVPANPCVAKIFEDYVKYFGLKELLDWADRVKWESTQRSQQATVNVPPPLAITPLVPVSPPATLNAKLQTLPTATVLKEEPKRDELKIVLQRINFVKEIVDGLRLMFDFLVGRILLYKQETKQFAKSKSFVYQPSADVSNSILAPLITKCKAEFQEDVEIEKDEPPTKRLTRTSKALAKKDFDSGTDEVPEPSSSTRFSRVSSSEAASTSSASKEKRCPSPDSKRRAQEYTKDLLNWKLLSTPEYNPSLIYGIIHLMRLFVKMPEILSKTTIPRRRLRFLVGHINLLLAFVAKYDGILDKRSLYYRNGEDEKAHLSSLLKT